MRHFKRLFPLFLSALLLQACGGSSAPAGAGDNNTTTPVAKDRDGTIYAQSITSPIGDTVWFQVFEPTHVKVGQKARVVLDMHPDVSWDAVVESISPATGALTRARSETVPSLYSSPSTSPSRRAIATRSPGSWKIFLWSAARRRSANPPSDPTAAISRWRAGSARL